ncbi:7716_t:CDS:2 [Cetraspora pellucida]|uniref:7716_t:CDS:1 n=1 Tax=Cetraspora pellucida TaxID=1433469 RepID=A0ACA9K3D5_9GLOM|nr:7716_t:CDS:2 [Cetraspora pellucida]
MNIMKDNQVPALEIAKFFLSLDPKREYFVKDKMIGVEGISMPMAGNLRLNKLLQITQMLYVAKEGKYLFPEKIGRPCVITKIEEEEFSFLLRLLTITSQNEEEIKEDEKQFISQYEIRKLPDCLKIDPSFVRIHQKNQNEYDFIVKKHEDYRNDKLNAAKLRPPIEIEIK